MKRSKARAATWRDYVVVTELQWSVIAAGLQAAWLVLIIRWIVGIIG